MSPGASSRDIVVCHVIREAHPRLGQRASLLLCSHHRVKAEPIVAWLFDRVHGHLGAQEQFPVSQSVIGEEADADAGSYPYSCYANVS